MTTFGTEMLSAGGPTTLKCVTLVTSIWLM
jgi:hypothetical protein